jgi:hypothetical protein
MDKECLKRTLIGKAVHRVTKVGDTVTAHTAKELEKRWKMLVAPRVPSVSPAPTRTPVNAPVSASASASANFDAMRSRVQQLLFRALESCIAPSPSSRSFSSPSSLSLSPTASASPTSSNASMDESWPLPSPSPSASMAMAIEAALYAVSPNPQCTAYKEQFRRMASALRDPASTLPARLQEGIVTPAQIVRMNDEELSSDVHRARLEDMARANLAATRSDLVDARADYHPLRANSRTRSPD